MLKKFLLLKRITYSKLTYHIYTLEVTNYNQSRGFRIFLDFVKRVTLKNHLNTPYFRWHETFSYETINGVSER